MKILTKEEIKSELGSFSLWSGKRANALVNSTKYMAGIKALDEFIEEKNIDVDLFYINLLMRPNGVEVLFGYKFLNNSLALLHDEINYWTLEQQKEVVGKKSKSVLGRALLGGLILGPLGAIIGGASGVGDKDIKLNDVDNIISISCTINNQEQIILLSCSDKKLKETLTYLKQNFKGKFKRPEEINIAVNA